MYRAKEVLICTFLLKFNFNIVLALREKLEFLQNSFYGEILLNKTDGSERKVN